MRIGLSVSLAFVLTSLACASTPAAGPLAEGSTATPHITAVDTAHPPQFAWVQLDQPAYAVLMLVAPGHSATLLYPSDSTTNNQLSAGAHQLGFRIPGTLVQVDTPRAGDRARARTDSALRYPGGVAPGTRAPRLNPPISPTTPVSLLLITSPQPISYRRVIEKTAGVSIPSMEMEALNAVAKAVKSTLTVEPREWAGYYQHVDLRPAR